MCGEAGGRCFELEGTSENKNVSWVCAFRDASPKMRLALFHVTRHEFCDSQC